MTNPLIKETLREQLRRLHMLAAGGTITGRQKQAKRLIRKWLNRG